MPCKDCAARDNRVHCVCSDATLACAACAGIGRKCDILMHEVCSSWFSGGLPRTAAESERCRSGCYRYHNTTQCALGELLWRCAQEIRIRSLPRSALLLERQTRVCAASYTELLWLLSHRSPRLVMMSGRAHMYRLGVPVTTRVGVRARANKAGSSDW